MSSHKRENKLRLRTSLRRTAILTAALFASHGVPAQTSTDPGAIQQQQQENLERQQREERLQQVPRAPQISTPRPGDGARASSEKNIRVERFAIDRSQILPAEEIDALLAPLQGTVVSLQDLYDLVGSINRLYDDRHQPTARAILPPQTVTDGTVRIRLVEARVGELRVGGTTWLRDDFIPRRLNLEPGQLMSVPQLESDLIRFNRLHETQLRAGIVAGKTFGTTDVDITAVEPPRQSYTLFADNAGRDTIGEGRLGLLARYTNPFGVDDSLQVLATTSEGSKNVSLAYSAEVARSGLRMDASISVGTVKVIAGTFAPLDITGESRDFSLGLSKPLEVSLERMWKLYGRWSMRDSRTEFGGFQQSDLDLRLITLGISGEARNDSRAWYTDHAIAAGIPYLGGERSFAYYRGSATRFDRLSERLQLVLRGGLQFSDTRFLPASEQFQIGGAYTVRGFSEGLLSGRSGYFGSVELRLAQSLAEYMQESAMPPSLQWVAFIDHGGALPYRPGILKEVGKDDFLTSAGVGVLFELGKRFSGRLSVAQPIHGNPAEARDRRPRAHVSVSIAL